MVQTGFQAAEHCWKCFKENDALTLIDSKPMNLCKGCLYTLKQMTNWLSAYGLAIKVVQPSLDDYHPTMEDVSEEGKGKVRVSRGRKGGEAVEEMVRIAQELEDGV